MVFAAVASHLTYCMMELHSIESSELMDLLAKYTSDYTKMLSERTSNEDYEKCKMVIKAIQAEIDFRKSNETSNITTPPDFVA